MAIQMGLDIHRDQMTYELIDTDTGELRRGRVIPGTRAGLRRLLGELPPGPVDVALEATTGWRFVVEELQAAGMSAHLAEPAETRALRGPKRRAKTDRADARHLRELLGQGRIPESWIPPAFIQDLRGRVRLRQALVEERTAWQQRIHALLFHHGHPRPAGPLSDAVGLDLPPAAAETLQVALGMIEELTARLRPLDAELRRFARAHPACRALMGQYGVAEIISCALLAELGDTRRFSSARHAVRFAGLDITVHASDGRRSPGRLSRQGSPLLRWAAYEAAQSAARAGSPDRPYYESLAGRLGKARAKLALARKIVRRSHHILRELGEDAMATPAAA
jgi:transposase